MIRLFPHVHVIWLSGAAALALGRCSTGSRRAALTAARSTGAHSDLYGDQGGFSRRRWELVEILNTAAPMSRRT